MMRNGAGGGNELEQKPGGARLFEATTKKAVTPHGRHIVVTDPRCGIPKIGARGGHETCGNCSDHLFADWREHVDRGSTLPDEASGERRRNHRTGHRWR